jgi:hypothetical protein
MQTEHSEQLCVENSDWGNELCAGENIGNRRKRSRKLRYGYCVLIAYCVRVIGLRVRRKGMGW